VAEPPDNSTERVSKSLSLPTGEGVVIDIGTGDGLFVYQCARRNPRKFYIGIDPNSRPLEKMSERIHRKPAKGGLANVLFLQAAIEDLPSELEGVADEVHIHFPWGSLLRGVAAPERKALLNLRRICSLHALLEVVIGLDPERDRFELERLQLRPLTLSHVDSVLTAQYRDAGFEILERGVIPPAMWPEFQTSWAKRLRGNTGREMLYIIARAC
jgi:16S rRNA (adenine(1408)-N(1))-methyltransferase